MLLFFDYSRFAHPSFISVLRALSHDEAKIIKQFCSGVKSINYIRYQRNDLDGTIVPMPNTFSNLRDLVTLDYPENDEFYINNLLSLGIVENIKTYLNSEVFKYDEIMKRTRLIKENYERQLSMLDDSDIIKSSTIDVLKGRFIITPYGQQFIRSISLD